MFLLQAVSCQLQASSWLLTPASYLYAPCSMLSNELVKGVPLSWLVTSIRNDLSYLFN
jgi:hypothetical protein